MTVLWHPVWGDYEASDPKVEHALGEHDQYPEPECCDECRKADR